MNLQNIKFLTTNPKKAKDFTDFGLGVQAFDKEIIEVLSQDVEIVALYKAKDTELNNIVVEDTALTVEGAEFFGTQIKYVYESIKEDESFNYHKTVWEVSLCMKKDEHFYIATGRTEGVLKYPALDIGYHFDRIFAVKNQNAEYQQFELFSPEEKQQIGPRFKALRLLTKALQNNDYSELKIIHEKDVPQWKNAYQEDVQQGKKIKP